MAANRLKPNYLTTKQFNFLEEYIKTENIKQSAINAGYGSGSAQACGRFLKTEKAKRYLYDRLNELDCEKVASANEVLEYFTKVMRGELKDQFDLEASLAERTRCAEQLAKRLLDKKEDESNKIMVNIINDIPRG